MRETEKRGDQPMECYLSTSLTSKFVGDWWKHVVLKRKILGVLPDLSDLVTPPAPFHEHAYRAHLK